MDNKTQLDIPISTILKVVLTLGALVLLYYVRDIILLLFIVMILVMAFSPVVERWGKKIGKPFSVTILVLILVASFAGLIYLVIPPLVQQSDQLVANFPGLLERFPYLKTLAPSFSQALNSLPSNFLSFTIDFLNGVFNFLTIIILVIYFLLDNNSVNNFAVSVLSEEKREEVAKVIGKISQKIGDWLRGQILICVIMGVITFLGLWIIGAPYALTIGVITGVLELVPIIGPIFSGALAVLVALAVSPITAIIVLVYSLITHQIEGSVLVPKIMQKALGLSPAIVIIAVIIGAKLFGIIGALLAVPIAGIIYVLIAEWPTIKRIYR